MSFKITTWNVNGIRALPTNLKVTLSNLNSDIVCLQETKVTREQLDSSITLVDGYNVYYSFCQKKAGYSGVAIFCRNPLIPHMAFNGLANIDGCSANGPFSDDEIINLDSEGRVCIVQFNTKCCDGENHKLTIINVYCPRADPEQPDRQKFKMDFHHLLQLRAEELAQRGHVIIAGDLNASHRRIDHCDPDGTKRTRSGVVHEEFISKPSRLWIDFLLTLEQRDPEIEDFGDKHAELRFGEGGIFADTFRVMHPNKENAYTCWLTVTGARETNYGNRIDYILADSAFTEECLQSCDIQPDVLGSDHCPVVANFAVALQPAEKCPTLCTRYLTEFQGTQRKISDFFNMKPAGSMPGTAKRRAGQACLDSFVSISKAKKPDPARSACQDLKFLARHTQPPATANAWKQLLTGPEPPPLCSGHQEPCVLRTVRKESLNKGRQFWVCSHPEGPPSNPKSRCEHFVWVKKK